MLQNVLVNMCGICNGKLCKNKLKLSFPFFFFFFLVCSLRRGLNGQDKSKEWGTADIVWPVVPEEAEHVLFKAKCHRGVRAWTLGTSFLYDQNRYAQNHGQCVELTLCSLHFSPVSPSNPSVCFPANSLGERSPFKREKKAHEREKRRLCSDWASWLSKSFSCKCISFYKHLFSQLVYNCSLTWFPHSCLKDALFLVILESQNNGMLCPLPHRASP